MDIQIPTNISFLGPKRENDKHPYYNNFSLENTKEVYLCFHHAVKATLEGDDIRLEITNNYNLCYRCP